MNDGEQQEQTERIRQFMEQQSTDQLLQIWTKGEEAEWTAQALDIARQTLESRVGALPTGLRQALAEESASGVEEVSEEPDTYHDLRIVVRIAKAAKAIGWAILGLVAIYILLDAVSLVFRLPPFNYQDTTFDQGVTFNVVRSWVFPVLYGGFFFAILQAVGEGLFVLLDIEDNTRGAGKP